MQGKFKNNKLELLVQSSPEKIYKTRTNNSS